MLEQLPPWVVVWVLAAELQQQLVVAQVLFARGWEEGVEQPAEGVSAAGLEYY